MKISIFDKKCSEEDFENDEGYFDSYLVITGLMIADSVTLISDDPRINCIFIEVSELPDKDVIEWLKGMFRYSKNCKKVIEYYDTIMPYIKKLMYTKQRDKETMVQYINFKSDISNFKKEISHYRETLLNDLYLNEVLPFYKEGHLVSHALEDIPDPNKEDVYIKPLVSTLTGYDEIIGFSEFMEDNYYHEIGDSREDECDFIKIPFLNFPVIKDMNYSQLKFTRNDLAPALLSFKKCLNELSAELLKIPYTVENLPQIKELCSEKLIPQISPVQQKIDESIYLCQQKNKNPENTGIEIALGISSANFILESLEYIDVILPYVRSEINQQVGRFIMPESGKVFIYYQENNP
jgi:hypothetical protein